MNTVPQTGHVDWIGIRPDRKIAMQALQSVFASPEKGLDGDRYGVKDGLRQVTLIQSEHFEVLASILSYENVGPEQLRRNLAISGINLLSLKNKQIIIGSVLLQVTGLCHPCSRMESVLGPGGYNAMRGHGGITARVLISGTINTGDAIRMVPDIATGKLETSSPNEFTPQPNNPNHNYAPINCSDYDYIELACLKKYVVDIETSDGVFRGKALDTKIENSSEYLVLQNTASGKTNIRLDDIIKLNVISTPSEFDEHLFQSQPI